MKKLLVLLLVGITTLTLTGCGKKEPVKVELSSDNFSDYIILDVQFEDADSKSKKGILGTEYKGTATLKATARLKKDVQVENVVIEGRIRTSGQLWSGNEYTFKLELDKNGEANYSKQVDTGGYTFAIKPEEQPIIYDLDLDPDEDEFIYDKYIIKVNGNVYDNVD